MIRIVLWLLFGSIVLLPVFGRKSFASEKSPLQTVDKVDLTKYAGRWFEIARLPNFFEKPDMHDITADYEILPSGMVSVRNSCTRGDGRRTSVLGVARSTDDSHAKLKVTFAPRLFRFLPFVWGDYWILTLDPDCQQAIVGDQSRRYLWFLSRKAEVTPEDYDRLCKSAADKGFNTSQLIRPKQQH